MNIKYNSCVCKWGKWCHGTIVLGVSNKISALLTPCHTWTVGPLCCSLHSTDSMSGFVVSRCPGHHTRDIWLPCLESCSGLPEELINWQKDLYLITGLYRTVHSICVSSICFSTLSKAIIAGGKGVHLWTYLLPQPLSCSTDHSMRLFTACVSHKHSCNTFIDPYLLQFIISI